VKTPKAAAPPPKDLPPPPGHNTTDPDEELLEERERMRLPRENLRQVVMHPPSKYHGSVVTEDDSDYDSGLHELTCHCGLPPTWWWYF